MNEPIRCKSRSPESKVVCTKEREHILSEDSLTRSHEHRQPGTISGYSWSSRNDRDELLREITGESEPEPTTRTQDVIHCARCKGDHYNVTFQRLAYAITVAEGAKCTYWAPCPTNGDPILLEIRLEEAVINTGSIEEVTNDRSGDDRATGDAAG